MVKTAVVFAAVAAGASAASIQARSPSCGTYQSLSNPGTGQCMIYVSYDNDSDAYDLALGDCGNDAEGSLPLTLDPTTQTIHTMDNKYCLGVLSGSSNAGATVGLVSCNDVDNGAYWTYNQDTDQFENEFGLCLDYNSDSDTFVQSFCQSAPLPMGSMQQYVFSGPTEYSPCPQPPPPNLISCGSWSVQNGGPVNACGAGETYTAGDNVMCSGGSSCQAACCSPAPPPPPPSQQSCGSWAVQYGGSPNCCGPDMIYTAGNGDMCDADGSNCQSQCCSNKLY